MHDVDAPLTLTLTLSLTLTRRAIACVSESNAEPDPRLRLRLRIRPRLSLSLTLGVIAHAETDTPVAVIADLLTVTGEQCAGRPPPVWKMALFTLIGLFLIAWPVNYNVPRYLSREGISDPYVATVCCVTINVVVNTYVSAPAVMLAFGGWIARPRPVYGGGPVKVLDEGLSFMGQVAVWLVYMGVLGALIIQNYENGEGVYSPELESNTTAL